MIRTKNRLLALYCLLFYTTFLIASDHHTGFEKIVETDLIILQPTGTDYSRFILKVYGSKTQFVQNFEANATPYISLEDPDGNLLPDGFYTFEIVPAHELIATPQAKASTDEHDRQAMYRSLPSRSPTSGSFRILYGEFVIPTLETNTSKDDSDDGPDHIINQDLIVRSSACIGSDCSSSETFDLDTLRLKENNLRINFHDTSNQSGFPSTDWQITINDDTSQGQNKFAIEDLTKSTIPFTIKGDAPSHAIVINQNGFVGFGTSEPMTNLHVKTGNTPKLRLEQDDSAGFTSQTWDIGGSEQGFFIGHSVADSRTDARPFRIGPNAPRNSLYIGTNGKIGLGTDSPEANLTVENLDPAGAQATNIMELRSQSPLQFQMTITESSTLSAWAFKAGYEDFVFKENSNNGQSSSFQVFKSGGIKVLGSSTSETPNELFEVTNTGDVRILGTTIHTSDVAMKENLGVVDPMSILARVNELPIARWQYLNDHCATDHIGPMAQDFHELFGLGLDDKGIASVDSAGVALAAIQALSQEIEARDVQIARLRAESSSLQTHSALLRTESLELKAKCEALESRLSALEKMLSQR